MSFKVSNTDLLQLLNHSSGKKHTAIAKARFKSTQRHFEKKDASAIRSHGAATSADGKAVPSTNTATVTKFGESYVVQIPSQQEQNALKVCGSNFSYRSCDGLSDLFRKMFPCEASRQFSMGKSKLSYLISDGLGSYYKSELVSMIRETGCPFTLQYDETGNVQNRKQCDVLLRYWRTNSGQNMCQIFHSIDVWACKRCRCC